MQSSSTCAMSDPGPDMAHLAQTAPSPGASARPLLDVRGVTLQYRTRHHLVTATHRVSFQVCKGDRFVLLGPSGCGKSTLLKGVGGFLRPVEGTMTLQGQEIRGAGPDRMMVFQEFDQLLPWKSVRQNVMFPLVTGGGLSSAAALDRAMKYIVKVGLEKFADAYPHTLSGGMKQRVGIARAMAMEPSMLLMDEPYAALDALTRRKMQEELLVLWNDTRFTTLFVTHSIEEAIVIGTRILVLTPHPGRVRAELNSVPDGVGSPAFAALQRRIEDMLFAPEPAAEVDHA